MLHQTTKLRHIGKTQAPFLEKSGFLMAAMDTPRLMYRFLVLQQEQILLHMQKMASKKTRNS